METKQKVVIRAQWRHAYQRWIIVTKTYTGKGGWKNYWNTGSYPTKEVAEVAIDKLMSDNPGEFERG